MRGVRFVLLLLLLQALTATLAVQLRLGSWNIRNVSSKSRTSAELGTIALIIARYGMISASLGV
jgi:hypothetical protein